MGPADPDVVQAAVVAQGELAVGAGAAGADAVVAVAGAVTWGGFGAGGAGGGGGGPVWQGPVRPLLVADGGEDVQQGLEAGGGGGLGVLGGEPVFEGLLETGWLIVTAGAPQAVCISEVTGEKVGEDRREVSGPY